MSRFSQKWHAVFHRIIVVIVPFTTLVMAYIATSGSAPGFSPEKTRFSAKFKGVTSAYRVMGVFLLPQEVLSLKVVDSNPANHYLIQAPTGTAKSVGTKRWKWQAPPSPGLYPVNIVDSQSKDSIILNVFVMVPYDQLQGEYLNSYRIGTYPAIPFKGLSVYKHPRGFVEVTKENEETLVAPHFKLKQFLCKQGGGYPKYLVLQERLLLKLELILERVNGKGYHCESFAIMSGYRTPYYNKVIGNVKYSRHLWGGAADIFIDENPKDGMMDDLNRNGKMDYSDATILYDITDELYGKSWYRPFVGGLARYKKTCSHGPFVHVDVRGFRARWGD